MLWRVRDILEVISPALRLGSLCQPSEVGRAMKAYNRINEILMSRDDWPGTEADVCFVTDKGCITLPSQFGAITALAMDGQPGRILPMGFEYLESGPGHISMRSPQGILQHLGDRFPTVVDLPATLPVGCFSSEKEDAGAELRFYGLDWQGRELRGTNGVPGFAIPILQGTAETKPAMTHVALSHISALVKPVTKGFIEVFAFDPDTQTYFWLSRLGQHETAPSLTRYLLTGVDAKHPVTVRARVSLQFAELYALDDISLIQHREVYRLMAQSIMAFDDEQTGKGSEYQERAVKMLKTALGKSRSGQRIALNVTNTNRPIRSGDRYSIRRFR